MLILDTETRSHLDIRRVGAYKYAEDFQLLLFVAYDTDRDAFFTWQYHMDDIGDLKAFLKDASSPFVAHNAEFDRRILTTTLGYDPANGNWIDTQAICAFLGMPLSLNHLGAFFGMPERERKDTAKGTIALHKFSIPNKKTNKFSSPDDFPEHWQTMLEYCKQDVVALHAIVRRLPQTLLFPRPGSFFGQSPVERLFHAATVTMPPIHFDLDEVRCLQTTRDTLIYNEQRRIEELTGVPGILTSPKKLLSYAHDNGYPLKNTQSAYLQSRLPDTALPQSLREVITARLATNKTSLAKLDAILDSATNTGDIYQTVQYCGATQTGRDAGRLIQPQNLPRSSGADITAPLTGTAQEQLETISKTLRQLIRAHDGYEFIGADYSSIESRVLAWLAGERWKLDFYGVENNPYDMYQKTFAEAFNCHVAEVSKSQRQVGKVMELALGYGGGVGAFKAMAGAYNMDLSAFVDTARQYRSTALYDEAVRYANISGNENDDVFIAIDFIKRRWRKANPNIVRMWSQLEDAVKEAALAHGRFVRKVGKVTVSNNFRCPTLPPYVAITLPSKRNLFYYYPQVTSDGHITFLGRDSTRPQFTTQETYGGKITENITQAVARDLLANAVAHLPVPCVMRVHDEVVVEVPEGLATPKWLEEQLCRRPEWGKDIPLKAEGWSGKRYGK